MQHECAVWYTPEASHGTWKSSPGQGDSYWKPSFSGSMLNFLGGSLYLQQYPVKFQRSFSIPSERKKPKPRLSIEVLYLRHWWVENSPCKVFNEWKITGCGNQFFHILYFNSLKRVFGPEISNWPLHFIAKVLVGAVKNFIIIASRSQSPEVYRWNLQTAGLDPPVTNSCRKEFHGMK